jgi:hypothetical protein
MFINEQTCLIVAVVVGKVWLDIGGYCVDVDFVGGRSCGIIRGE